MSHVLALVISDLELGLTPWEDREKRSLWPVYHLLHLPLPPVPLWETHAKPSCAFSPSQEVSSAPSHQPLHILWPYRLHLVAHHLGDTGISTLISPGSGDILNNYETS